MPRRKDLSAHQFRLRGGTADILSTVVLCGTMNSEKEDRIEEGRTELKESKPAEGEHLRGDNDKAGKMVWSRI